VVYFPTCGARIFGTQSSDEAALPDVIMTLLTRAGYAPRLPDGFDTLCCGQMLASKGMSAEAEQMADVLADAVLKAADDGHGGTYPIIMDASTCSARMQQHLAGRLRVLDFHEFAHDALLPRLMIQRKVGPIALHVNCSVRRSASEEKLRRLLAACAEQVVEPAGVTCCGFGGDRGFVVPELNAHALRKLHDGLPESCCEGVSTNRTCEIGLSAESGRPYRSVAYLLEECSRGAANSC
jgi:D-lactate dehydrogenase